MRCGIKGLSSFWGKGHKGKLLILSGIIFLILVVDLGNFWFQVGNLKTGYPHLIRKNLKNEDPTAILEINAKPWKGWTSYGNISKVLRDAVVVSEDWAFYQHGGIDFNQLRAAFKEGIRGKRLRGASTITQQLAKNLYLSSERSWIRKFREFYITLIIEARIKKTRILEIYLNVVEFGKNIYGISSASWTYFNKPPGFLNARESAFIAMLLPSPVKYSVSFRKKELTTYAKKTISRILQKLKRARKIDEFDMYAAMGSRFSWEPSELDYTLELLNDSELDMYEEETVFDRESGNSHGIGESSNTESNNAEAREELNEVLDDGDQDLEVNQGNEDISHEDILLENEEVDSED